MAVLAARLQDTYKNHQFTTIGSRARNLVHAGARIDRHLIQAQHQPGFFTFGIRKGSHLKDKGGTTATPQVCFLRFGGPCPTVNTLISMVCSLLTITMKCDRIVID